MGSSLQNQLDKFSMGGRGMPSWGGAIHWDVPALACRCVAPLEFKISSPHWRGATNHGIQVAARAKGGWGTPDGGRGGVG